VKLLLAGNWQYDWYESACAEALRRAGVDVIPFRFAPFFQGYAGWRYLGKVEEALPMLPGPALARLNGALLRAVQAHRPDCVLIWRGTHVLPLTLRAIRERTGAKLASYNNDDPFGPWRHRRAPWHHRVLWIWYLAGLKESDLTLVYRPVNVGEAQAAGARNVRVLVPYFVPWIHRPLELSDGERQQYDCDVVFVGHYERDGREEYIRALIAAGFRVRVFGGEYWNRWAPEDLRNALGTVTPVYGDEYAKALSGAKVALGLLSRLNRDVYTRRHFEIPACGGLLVSERTHELEGMFKDGEEVVFFSSPSELVERVRTLLADPVEQRRIRENGRRRVWQDGHDVVSRMRELVELLVEA
jgi:glycosyltransferase involved in cell wall biosynthesis